MQRALEFIRATIMGGLFVLLPVSLLFLLLTELFDLAVAVATPITLLFPEGEFDEARFPTFLAIGLIVTMSLVLGLLMRSWLGIGLGRWIERSVLMPLPGYGFLKNLTHSLGNTNRVSGFKPVLKHLPDGGFQIAYLVEEDSQARCTILLPHAPAAMSGPVEIVPRDKLRVLDCSFGEVMQSLNHWGLGAQRFVLSVDENSELKGGNSPDGCR